MSECIDHGQAGNRFGYGRYTLDSKRVYAHRVSYCAANNCTLDSIAELVVRHTCDNPRCINPEHLIIGTHRDNVDDKISRGRQLRGEGIAQSKLTAEQVACIRSRYKFRCPVNGSSAMAREYGVHQSVVSRIVNNKVWYESISA